MKLIWLSSFAILVNPLSENLSVGKRSLYSLDLGLFEKITVVLGISDPLVVSHFGVLVVVNVDVSFVDLLLLC